MSIDPSALLFVPSTVGALMAGTAAAGAAAMGAAMMVPAVSRRLMPMPRETRLVDFMPFGQIMADGETITTQRGDLVRVIKVQGAELTVTSQGESEALFHARRTWLSQIAEKKARARVFTIRTAVNPGELMEHPVAHLSKLANTWETAFQRNSFSTDHYIVLSTEKEGGMIAMDEATSLTISALSPFKAKVLNDKTDESPLKILGRLASPITRPNPKAQPGLNVSEAIVADQIHFADDKTGHITFTNGNKDLHLAIIGIKTWGDLTEEKMLLDMASLPFDYTIYHNVEPLGRTKATTTLDLQFRLARTTLMSETSHAQFAAVGEIIGGGGEDTQCLCSYSLSIVLEAATQEELDRRISQINTIAAQYQVMLVREGIAAQATWWSMFPTYDIQARPWKVLAANVATLLVMQRANPGAKFSPWGKSPITMLRTSSGSPYNFVFHDMSDPSNKEPLGHMLVVGPSGSGKAQPDDAPILTATGWSTMGEMRIGRMLRMPDGSLAPVTGVHPQGMKDVWEVGFEDGRSTECCIEHLWKVWNADRKAYDVVDLDEVIRRHEVASRHGRRISIPLVESDAVEMPHSVQPVPAYAIGAMLGDGCMRKRALTFSSAEPEHTIRRLEEILPEYEFAHESGVDYRARMRNQHETALFKGEPSPYQRTLVHDGREMTIREWAAETSIPSGRIHARCNQGWTPSEALGFEHRRRNGKSCDFARFDVAGESLTVAEMSARCDVAKTTLRERLVRGWTPEQAMGLAEAPNRRQWGENPLIRDLKALGLWGLSSHEKFVPDCYKAGSVAQRYALIQGLMDTDGSAEGTIASFSSTSERLALDVQEIVRSLGGIASIAPRQTFYTDEDGAKRAGRPSWRLSIRHPELKRLFSLPRKVQSCRKSQTARRLAITSITRKGRKEMRCISVGHPEHLYITNDYVVTHNTVTVSWLATMAMRYPELRVFFFDRFNGTEVVTNMSGGKYVKFDGTGAAMNPLQMDLTPRNKTFLQTWFQLITGLSDPASTEQFGRAIDMLELMPKEDRNLKRIQQTVFAPDSEARNRIRPWIMDNQNGQVFCAPEDTMDLESRMISFDFTTILDPDRKDNLGPAVVSYVMHRTMDVSVQQGHPAVYFVDETAPLLKNEYFAARFAAGLQEGRKLGQVFICAFQRPNAIEESGHGQTILGQCATQVFFPNAKAKKEDFAFFGLTDRELNFVLGKSHNHLARKFLLRRISETEGIESVVIDADMRALGDGLQTFASGNAAVRRIRELIDKDPENFRKLYMEHVAADRMSA